MALFDDREKAAEARFVHDSDLRFRAEARRNKLLAHWACGLMGTEDDNDKANYTAELIAVDMVKGGYDEVIEKIVADFKDKKVDQSESQVRAKASELDAQAKREILNEA